MITLENTVQEQLKGIWDSYVQQGKKTYDLKGREYEDINRNRLRAIEQIRKLLKDFFNDKLSLPEFKTNLDSYNKQNNYWGFTAAKGQMFFNLLTRSSVDKLDEFVGLLKSAIREPLSLDDALAKIKTVHEYAYIVQRQAPDKRYVANPKSSAYFLSYFWQVHNPERWPIMYTSLIVAFEKLGIWQSFETAYENYQYFFNLNEEVKAILSKYAKRTISNWDLEHALWNFAGTTGVNSKQAIPKRQRKEGSNTTVLETVTGTTTTVEQVTELQPGFELNDYLIPRIARLYDLGAGTDKSGSTKGREFERLVSEAFRFLDFEVELLGQGSGREPDAILKYPEEHIAFIVDAKAYSSGYTVGTDDRAIREYINHHCPKLKREGFTRIGFIIVSNSFKSEFKDLVDNITWTTDIKRFLLLSTRALLYLVAYKAKDQVSLPTIVDKLISFDKPITDEMIVERFADV